MAVLIKENSYIRLESGMLLFLCLKMVTLCIYAHDMLVENHTPETIASNQIRLAMLIMLL